MSDVTQLQQWISSWYLKPVYLKSNHILHDLSLKLCHFHNLHYRHVYVLVQWTYKQKETRIKSTKKSVNKANKRWIFLCSRSREHCSQSSRRGRQSNDGKSQWLQGKKKTGEMLRFLRVFGLRYPHNTHNWMCFHIYLRLSFISPLSLRRSRTGSRRARWSSGWHRESPPGRPWPEE